MSSAENLKALKAMFDSDYTERIVCFVFPGLFLLETIYHKGLFSGGVNSPYDFVMLLFWCIAISIIYLHTAFINIRIEDVVGKHFPAKGQTSAEKEKEAQEKEKEKEEQEKRVYGLYIPPLMILTVLTYVFYNFIKYYCIVYPEKGLGIPIPSIHMVFMLSFLTTFVCSYPIGCFYRKALDKIIESRSK